MGASPLTVRFRNKYSTGSDIFWLFAAGPAVDAVIGQKPDGVLALTPCPVREQAAGRQRPQRLLHLSVPQLHDEYVVQVHGNQLAVDGSDGHDGIGGRADIDLLREVAGQVDYRERFRTADFGLIECRRVIGVSGQKQAVEILGNERALAAVDRADLQLFALSAVNAVCTYCTKHSIHSEVVWLVVE